MRVAKFIKQYGLTFNTMFKAAQFLGRKQPSINDKLTPEDVDIFLKAVSDEEFNVRLDEFESVPGVPRPINRSDYLKFEGLEDLPVWRKADPNNRGISTLEWRQDIPFWYDEQDSSDDDVDVEDYESIIMRSFENGTSELYGL